LDELPFKAAMGVWGSYVCLFINIIALMAQFYVALYPVGGPNLNAETFFELYLAGPFLIGLYCMWKGWSWFKRPEDRPLYVKIKDIDIYNGMRDTQRIISGPDVTPEQRIALIAEKNSEEKRPNVVMRVIRNVF
jgi:amino acid transporter